MANNFVFRSDFGQEQNKSEQVYVYPNRINFGALNDAPLAANRPKMPIDIGAHWYNDFGLEKTAAAPNQANGAYLWYDWSWNHTTNPNYDPSRHPLLGWYQGDNAKVLDWQCYWLAASGVNVIIPSDFIDSTSTWSNPSDKSYWVYQLFNHVKNFQNFKYILWLKGADHTTIGAPAVPNSQQDDVINNIVANKDNVYCYLVNGKRYPAFYLWDSEGWRGTYDSYNGSANSVARMKVLANKMRTLGYDGIAFFARNLKTVNGTYPDSVRQNLEASGVYLFGLEYSDLYNNANGTGYNNSYENYANTVKFPQEDYKIINVLTSAKTQAPHPSGWTTAGSTPALFQKVLQKAADATVNSNKPKLVTIYNVAEWAEGGPGLQPNKQDQFGYLESVRSLAFSEPAPDTNTKDWLFTKKRLTVNGGTNGRETTFDFDEIANFYNSSDNPDDYIFNLSIDYSGSTQDEAVANLHYVLKPQFSSGKVSVKVYNDSGADIPNVGFNLEIKRKPGVVPPANTAPSITSTFNTTTAADSASISIPYIVTDAEGGAMTAILTKDGVVTNQSAQVGQNVWNVGTLPAGSHTLSIQVRDSGNLLSNTLTFNITVTATQPSNTAPSITSAFNTTTADDSASISISYTVTDAEGGAMTAILTKDGVVTNQSAQVGQNVWNVGTLPAGSHTLSIQVRDSGNLLSNTLTFNITVTATQPSNTAPSITSAFNTTTTDDSTSISISYTVTDAEGGAMTAILTKDGVVTNQSAQVGQNVWNVGTLPAGSHTLSIQVRDGGNLLSNTLTFNITVTQSGVDPNQPATESIKTWVGGITPSQGIGALKFIKNFSSVRLRVSTSQDLSNPIRSAPQATVDNMLKVTMTGLQPNTQYFYGVEISGVLQNEGRGKFKTFPVGPASFECMFASCAQTGSNSTVFETIRNQNPLFFIHMGDLHYRDINYNDKWAFWSAYDQVLGASRQHALYSNIPTMYVWDDHDFGGNDSDGTAASRPAAQAAYRDRVPHYPLPSTNGAIYQSWVVGRVRFIMTDLESNSSKTSNADNSSKTKMGEEQIQWFFSELLKPEPLKVWISSKPWIGSASNGSDKWWSYSTERKRIANFIKNNGLQGKVIILSGDMHGIGIDSGVNADYADGGGADIPVFQAAPLDQSASVKGGPYDKGTYLNGSSGRQYGKMTITDTGASSLTVKWEGKRDSTTVVTHTMQIPAN